MDNSMNTNQINPNTVPSKEVKKGTLDKKSFLNSPGGIVTIIVIIFLLLAGVAVVSYNLALNNKSKQADNNVTPTPTPTTTDTPTPSVTTTLPPIVTTQVPAANGKFTVETNTESLSDGTPVLEYNIKLNGTVVKNIKGDTSACKSIIPVPITSVDKTKVYYVEPANNAVVKVMNASKAESTFFTASAPYKLVTAMAINSKGKFAYTVSDKTVVSCDAGYNTTTSAFIIDGKVISQNPTALGGQVFENVEAYGDNYFITTLQLNGVGVGGGAQTTTLRKAVDGSLVKSFSSAGVIYSAANYAIVADGYGDVPEIGPEYAKDQNVFKVDLSTGALTYIVSDTMVSNFEFKNGKLIITYGGYLNSNYEIVGPTKTIEYSL